MTTAKKPQRRARPVVRRARAASRATVTITITESVFHQMMGVLETLIHAADAGPWRNSRGQIEWESGPDVPAGEVLLVYEALMGALAKGKEARRAS